MDNSENPTPSDPYKKTNHWSKKFLEGNGKVTIAFAVTEVSNTNITDDYQKAKALSVEFINLGWNVVFLNRLKRQWYKLESNVDIILTFSDLYDLSKIESLNTNLVKIAWASKWFQQWKSLDYLDNYLFILGVDEDKRPEQLTISDNPIFHLPLTTEIINKDFTQIAKKITKEVIERLTKLTISLKIPAKYWDGINSWGDYHFAVLLKQQLDKKGFFVHLHVQSEWYGNSAKNCNINLVLRGLRKHIANNNQINIMWNISHPDSIKIDEYEDYDYVYVASTYWAKKLATKIKTPVEPLLQCTDTKRFYPPSSDEIKKHSTQLLFVGNSRGIFRPILKSIIPTKYDLSIYGEHHTDEIPRKHIIDNYLPNEQLYKHYGAAGILLNDHWDDMKNKGFISNRIYDGLASGAFIISDRVKNMNELENYLITYETDEELNQLVDYYLSHPEQREKINNNGLEFIEKNHTFEKRANKISETIVQLVKLKFY